MDDEQAKPALLGGLAGAKRTKTGRLRELLPEIERARELGISHAEILERLNALGLDLTYKTYTESLYRIRRKREKAPPAPAPAPTETVSRDNPLTKSKPPPEAKPAVDESQVEQFQSAKSDPYGVIPDPDAVSKKFENYQSSNSLLNRKKTGES